MKKSAHWTLILAAIGLGCLWMSAKRRPPLPSNEPALTPPPQTFSYPRRGAHRLLPVVNPQEKPVLAEPGRSVKELKIGSWKPAEKSPREDASEKLAELEEILASGNDNDPRLDRNFRTLSAQAKRLFREKYSRLELEKRNSRGMLVFLLGRELSSPEDWAFMRRVLNEPACLSLNDCRQDAPDQTTSSKVNVQISLAYPQLVVLKHMERILREPHQEGLGRFESIRTLSIAKASPNPLVAAMAQDILSRSQRHP